MDKRIFNKAKKVKIFLMDVDGVLTDGKMYFFSDSRGKTHEIKAFNALDGIGLMLLARYGIKTGIITGRQAKGAEERARMMRMDYAYQGFLSKLAPLEEILRDCGFKPDEAAYMGDDITDIPVLQKVGLACAPQNAVKEVKKNVDIVTNFAGGEGAVRQICDLILSAKGLAGKIGKDIQNEFWPKGFKKELKVVFYSDEKKGER